MIALIKKIISLLLSLLILCGSINVVNAENISISEFDFYEYCENAENSDFIKFIYDNGGILEGE